MEARLPREKLHKCLDLLSVFFRRCKVTLKEIQSLTVLLNFACKVDVPDRAFLRKPHFLIRLSIEVKEDLLVWQSFLSSYNGRSFFLSDQRKNSHQLEQYTDSPGALGRVLFLVDIGVTVSGRIAGVV